MCQFEIFDEVVKKLKKRVDEQITKVTTEKQIVASTERKIKKNLKVILFHPLGRGDCGRPFAVVLCTLDVQKDR